MKSEVRTWTFEGYHQYTTGVFKAGTLNSEFESDCGVPRIWLRMTNLEGQLLKPDLGASSLDLPTLGGQ